MIITFHIEYYAPFDAHLEWQRLGREPVCCQDSLSAIVSFPMRRVGEGEWSVSLDVESGERYRYALVGDEQQQLRAEESPHRIDFPAAAEREELHLFDSWYDAPSCRAYSSSLFTESLFRRDDANIYGGELPSEEGSLLLAVECPSLLPTQSIAVVGSCVALGEWSLSDSRLMSYCSDGIWRITLPEGCRGSEYKFIIVDTLTHSLVRYEQGANRRLPNFGGVAVVRGLRLRDDYRWRGSGVAIPLFSMRSQQGWGCGDVADIMLLGDWASSIGMSVIQLLPINDTTTGGSWRDSYPYNAISSFALHPIYISPRMAASECAAVLSSGQKRALTRLLRRYSLLGEELNKLSAVDYEAVYALKLEFLRALYRVAGEVVLSTDEYKSFYRESRSWLLPYSIFCALRDKHSSCDFKQWGSYARYSERKAVEYSRQHSAEVGFYAFVQYLLDCQLREAREYIHSKRVALKGDIPIGVSPLSVDVWCEPQLYNCEMSAGAPPDAFAAEGQNWGFPTYNWERMAQDDYSWWRRRLAKMARYFDAYRIDHILGFFRIWEVERSARSALMGHFYPSSPLSKAEIESYGFDFCEAKHCSEGLDNPDTLFLRYPYAPGGYSPRIEGYSTTAYSSLSDEQQRAYSLLYEEFFYKRHNEFWSECALRRLPKLMAASAMLTCGEDLGMIPASVPEVMRQEQILSLEIERMPKAVGIAFAETTRYPYLSVATTSTHDTSTLRGWWREDRASTQRYWSEVLHLSGEADEECSASVAYQILRRTLLSGSMLAILPMQDWLAIDDKLRLPEPDAERINIPANPRHYWRWRMHLNLEELISQQAFNARLRELVALREAL